MTSVNALETELVEVEYVFFVGNEFVCTYWYTITTYRASEGVRGREARSRSLEPLWVVGVDGHHT